MKPNKAVGTNVVCYTHFGPEWPSQPCNWCAWLHHWGKAAKQYKKSDQVQKETLDHMMAGGRLT